MPVSLYLRESGARTRERVHTRIPTESSQGPLWSELRGSTPPHSLGRRSISRYWKLDSSTDQELLLSVRLQSRASFLRSYSSRSISPRAKRSSSILLALLPCLGDSPESARANNTTSTTMNPQKRIIPIAGIPNPSVLPIIFPNSPGPLGSSIRSRGYRRGRPGVPAKKADQRLAQRPPIRPPARAFCSGVSTAYKASAAWDTFRIWSIPCWWNVWRWSVESVPECMDCRWATISPACP